MQVKLRTDRCVSPDASSLIVTKGEFNAMSVYQAMGRPAASLPNGCRSLPAKNLALLAVQRGAPMDERRQAWEGGGQEVDEEAGREEVPGCVAEREAGRRSRPGPHCG